MKIPHEKGVANHSAPNFARYAARHAVKRKTGEEAGWVLSSENKPIRTPTLSYGAEGHADGSASASSRTVLRSRRPQSTPRYFLHENRETSPVSPDDGDRWAKAKAARPACTPGRSRTAA
jgi:hypothetical protein